MTQDADGSPTGTGAVVDQGPRGVTRRRVLAAGIGAACCAAAGGGLVETEVLPGRTRLHRLLGIDGPDAAIPDITPGPRTSGSLVSRYRKGRTGWALSYPPGFEVGAELPIVVVLHGKDGDHSSAFDELGLDRFLAQSVKDGVEPFAVASVDGGNTYWHRRQDGSDTGRMVVEDLMPLLAGHGLDLSRVGLMGWSMGGYGALLLASQGRLELRAVAALSAALWHHWDETAPGAFDGPEDFHQYNLFERTDRLAGVVVRLACGEVDPFIGSNRDLAVALDGARTDFGPGAHRAGYWRSALPAQLRFLSEEITRP